MQAQEAARGLKHNYIGTEHILLGLLREQEGLAARVLESLGITVDRVRGQVAELVGSGEEVTSGQIPFTPRAKKVLELALREALGLGHSHIGTEHVLLGLVRENEGVAARILLDFDVDAEKIRREVLRIVPPSEHRVVAQSTRAAGFDEWISVGPAASLHPLLMLAAARALDDGRSEIDPHDLLLALTRHEKTAPLLADLGVDEAAVRTAIQRRRAADERRGEPPDPPAPG